GPTLAETGAGSHEQWLGIGAVSLVALGSAVLFFSRRRAN
ncbi:LAETG motif-containing sortase-dependent surface protein, partial [Streptomyces longispororuber]